MINLSNILAFFLKLFLTFGREAAVHIALL